MTMAVTLVRTLIAEGFNIFVMLLAALSGLVLHPTVISKPCSGKETHLKDNMKPVLAELT